MPSQEELLANVIRKAILSRNDPFGCYIDIDEDSIVIDGRVEKLTPEEVQALKKIDKETEDG